MSFKDVLTAKVPDFVKNSPEWTVFLRWLSQNDITSNAQLNSVLNAQIQDCQLALNKSMSSSFQGTNNRVDHALAKKLDFLKLVKTKIMKYF